MRNKKEGKIKVEEEVRGKGPEEVGRESRREGDEGEVREVIGG